MYVGRDFDPSDDGEDELYTFDFIKDLQKGDTISNAVWSCSVAMISEAADDQAAAHVAPTTDDPQPVTYSGTKTSCRVHGLLPGVIYKLQAVVDTANGDRVSLWSHVECGEPG